MMKKVVVYLCVVLMLVGASVSTSVAAYISGSLGAVMVNDSDVDDGIDTGEFTFDTGFSLLAAMGADLQSGGRGEVEFGYRANDFDEITLDGFGTANIDGDVTTISLMGNAYYDFETTGSFSPFIGAGLGFANVEADIDFAGSEDDSVFAYQFILGGSIAANEMLSIDLQYRFFATEDPEFDGLETEYSSHNFMIGLRHSF